MCFGLLLFLKVLLGFLWFLIIPEWLINDFGWIAIFVVMCGTSKKSTKNGPSDPLFITEILQKIQENMETIYKILCW